MIFPIWRQSYESIFSKSDRLIKLIAKKNRLKNGLAKIWIFEDDIRKPFFANKFSSSEKRALPLHATKQRLFQSENGFVRTFVSSVLLVSGIFLNLIIPFMTIMNGHAHFANWLQSGTKQVSNSLVNLCLNFTFSNRSRWDSIVVF